MFTLRNNGIDAVKKYRPKQRELFTFIPYEDDFFSCCNAYSVGKLNTNANSVNSNVKDYFIDATKKSFIQASLFKSSFVGKSHCNSNGIF